MRFFFFLCLCVLTFSGCTQRSLTYKDADGNHQWCNPSSLSEDEKNTDPDDPELKDPLEPLNRFFFGFNRLMDNVILKPLAVLYEGLLPSPIQKGLKNFVQNIFAPVSMINYSLQGDGQNFAATMWRFMFNSTVGLLGVIDVADYAGVSAKPTNFNETLAKWNVSQGGYVMLPAFGPSCMRNAAGSLFDFITNPFSILANHKKAGLKPAYGWNILALDLVQRRASLLGVLDDIEATSDDPYVTVRSMYLQKQDEIDQKAKEPTKK